MRLDAEGIDMGFPAKKLPEEAEELREALQPTYSVEQMLAAVQRLRAFASLDVHMPFGRPVKEHRAALRGLEQLLTELNVGGHWLMAQAQPYPEIARE
jgi:hypothetical protein